MSPYFTSVTGASFGPRAWSLVSTGSRPPLSQRLVMSLLLGLRRRGRSSLRSPSQPASQPCTAHYRWIYVPKRHESVIVIDRAVSPSLTVGPILSTERYPSSAFLGKHGPEPKLGSNARLATRQ